MEFERENVKIKIIIMLAILVLLAFAIFPLAQESMVYADGVSSDTSWVSASLLVTNNVNKYTFKLPCQYKYTASISEYTVRFSAADVSTYSYYFEIQGYTYNNDSFGIYELNEEQTYYSANVTKLANATLSMVYTPKTYTIIFKDSMTDEVLSTLTTSYGGSVIPPEVDEKANYVFCGWTGGSYSKVTRNATLYTNYQVCRYVTFVLEKEGKQITVAVPVGTTLSDVEITGYENYVVKSYKTGDDETVDPDTLVYEDLLLYTEISAVASNQFDWGKFWLIFGCVIAGSAIVIAGCFVAKRMVNKRVKNNY